MTEISQRPFQSLSDNRQSKIQNRKLAGIVALVIAFAMGGALAEAQQPGKIFRIGVLDTSTASSSAAQWQAFRQELNKFGWTEGKNIAFEYRFAEQRMTVCLTLQRLWLVLRSI
jgi:hypothetical protein